MSFYSELKSYVVIPLLTKFGVSITLLRPEESGKRPFDYELQEFIGDSTDLEYTGIGVITEYTFKEKDDTQIQEGDKKLIASLNVTPETTDKIKIGSDVYNIVNISVLSPGNTDLLYQLQVRL